jgi:hypothetical protein
LFRLRDLADREEQGGSVNGFMGRDADAIRWIVGHGLQQGSSAPSRQGRSQRRLLRRGEFQLREVEDARVIEAPLDEVGCVNDGRLERGLAQLGDALFTVAQQDHAGFIAQFGFSFQHRKQCPAGAGFDFQGEFGATRGGRSRWRPEPV